MTPPALKKAYELHDLLETCLNFHGSFEEREHNEERLWQLTFEEAESVGIFIDKKIKEDGMLLDAKPMHDKLFYIYLQVYEESKHSTHCSFRFDTILSSLSHMYCYWK